jgi:hypothetical protein
MQTITTIGLDIAKSVFQVHGVDVAGEVVVRRQLTEFLDLDRDVPKQHSSGGKNRLNKATLDMKAKRQPEPIGRKGSCPAGSGLGTPFFAWRCLLISR